MNNLNELDLEENNRNELRVDSTKYKWYPRSKR